MECLEFPTPEVSGIVNLFAVKEHGPQLAAQLRLREDGHVDIEVIDSSAHPYVHDVREDGVWSQGLGRTVRTEDGEAFLVALMESLVNSSYWHAAILVRTPAHLPLVAEASTT